MMEGILEVMTFSKAMKYKEFVGWREGGKRRTFLTQRMGDGWLWVVSISVNVSGGGWAGKGQYKRNNCCEVRSCKRIILKFTRIHPP